MHDVINEQIDLQKLFITTTIIAIPIIIITTTIMVCTCGRYTYLLLLFIIITIMMCTWEVHMYHSNAYVELGRQI